MTRRHPQPALSNGWLTAGCRFGDIDENDTAMLTMGAGKLLKRHTNADDSQSAPEEPLIGSLELYRCEARIKCEPVPSRVLIVTSAGMLERGVLADIRIVCEERDIEETRKRILDGIADPKR